MDRWKALWERGIWKVPLYCTIAGMINVYVEIYLLQWAIVRLPDGSFTSDYRRTMIVYGAVFLITMLIGGLVFFRKMTRREIVYSASLLSAYGLVLTLLQQMFHLNTGMAALWVMRLFYPFHVFSFPVQLCLGIMNAFLLGIAVQLLCPYLFVLFGKRGEIDS